VVDPCGFATATHKVYVVGNPAHLFTAKIADPVRNHLNFERIAQQRLKLQLHSRTLVILRRIRGFHFPDPPVLGPDTGIARKNEDCISIGGRLTSNLSPSVENQCHWRAHIQGCESTPSPSPSTSIDSTSVKRSFSFILSGIPLTKVFESQSSEPPLVQSPRETLVPSGSSHFQSSDSQCYSLKDLVDELLPFQFVHSPIVNSQRRVWRSVEYEDLLKNAKEGSPLRRRRMVRGVTYSVET
jgi:hypothetical protein